MSLPFITGVAAQNYLTAEDGILSARENYASHWYIDASLEEERPDQWSI